MNAHKPQISIVLRTYNRAHYLSQTIESCLAQSFKDFELIIIDDASSDNTASLVSEYIAKDDRVRFIQNVTNKKLPATLNIAFAAAHGDYFTWISDDNLFHLDALMIMKNYLDEHPDVGLVYTDYTLIDDEGVLGKRIYQEGPEFLPIRDCVLVQASYTVAMWLSKQANIVSSCS